MNRALCKKFIYLRYLGFLFSLSAVLSSCDESYETKVEKQANGFVNSGAKVIISSLEFSGIDKVPPRNSIGLNIIDMCVVNDGSFGNNGEIARGMISSTDDIATSEKFGFPSSFLSSGRPVKCGLSKNDYRRYSLEFIVLWKLNEEEKRWRKKSVIMTRDLEIVAETDEYVTDAWINDNLLEFPYKSSRTQKVIDKFNEMNARANQ